MSEGSGRQFRINRSDLAVDDSVVDRLSTLGPGSLALWELCDLVIGRQGRKGQVREREQDMATELSSVSALAGATFDDLVIVMGRRRAATLAAALELGRRVHVSVAGSRPEVRTAADVYRLLEDMRRLDREHFRVVLLNVKHQVLRVLTVSIGGLSHAPVHPREVFKGAIRHSASRVIVVHNHPSGDATPSHEDRLITDQLAAAGKVIGIPVLDHVIIGDGHYVSLCEQGLLASGS